MRPITKVAILAGGGLLAAWIGWGLYTKQSAETVPYETEATVDSVEIRRYPATVSAETTARNQMTGFRRLFDYISGSNEGGESVSMTAPVKSSSGTSISMTAPVRTESADEDIMQMGFYLPARYDMESAPKPTDADVSLREEPARTLAVVQFSWYAPERRVRTYRSRLLDTLESEGYETAGKPFLLRYNDPWTPPFMRRNEVAVEIEDPKEESGE
jgi:hypothetical protein